MVKKIKYKINKNFKRIPISKKITFLYAGVFTVVLILSSVFIFTNLRYYYKDTSKKELLKTIEKVEQFITDGGKVTSENLSQIINSNAIEARVLINSSLSDAATNPDMTPNPSAENGKLTLKKYTFMDKQYLYCEESFEYNKIRYTIQAFRLYESEANLLRFLSILFIVVNILGIIFSYFIGVIISKKFLKPVRDITDTAEKISLSDLNLRIDVPESDDEIKDLAITFNDMIARLESSFENQKQFISDASHELRTPISVIQGYANLMCRWGKDDPEVLDESINSIKSETEYMAKLVNQMLYLARGEKKKDEIVKTVFNLNSLLEEVIKDAEVSNRIKINYSHEGSFNICADENLIKQLIYIFIENAVKYSKPDSKSIEIRLYGRDESNAVIEIKDFGIGISEEDIPHIFERFYRGDKSRNKQIPGTGLGLSIAKYICDVHNGKIETESVLGEGTVFKIILPAVM